MTDELTKLRMACEGHEQIAADLARQLAAAKLVILDREARIDRLETALADARHFATTPCPVCRLPSWLRRALPWIGNGVTAILAVAFIGVLGLFFVAIGVDPR